MEKFVKNAPIRFSKLHRLTFWEVIPKCAGEECPLYSTCLYPKVGPCKLRLRYIMNIERCLMKALNVKDPMVKLKIGTHLVPLYNQLFVAKMACLEKESKENLRVVREVMRSIDNSMRGLSGSRTPSYVPSGKGGDSDYYDTMFQSKKKEAAIDKSSKVRPVHRKFKRVGVQKIGAVAEGAPKTIDELEKELGVA